MVTIAPSAELRALAAALGDRATLMKPLGPLTTYGVGGPAALFVEIDEPADLDARPRRAGARDRGVPLFVIGRGSNLLVADAGFDGIAVHLGPGFAELELPAPRTPGPPRGAGRGGAGAPGAGAACRRRRVVRACPGPSGCPARSGAPYA